MDAITVVGLIAASFTTISLSSTAKILENEMETFHRQHFSKVLDIVLCGHIPLASLWDLEG